MDKSSGPGVSGNGGVADLLSIDADAHLRKLAACMFPTPAQLPVELVRDAIKRGAASVAVLALRHRLVVVDDGAGIAAGPWRELACALDSRGDPVEREKAIASLQRAASPGIGILAALVPGARHIRIENGGPDSPAVLTAADGRVQVLAADALPRGTRVTIRRRGGPVASERKLLQELCAAVPQDITLNGRKIERKALLRRTLVQQAVDRGEGAVPALVGVPARGDICRTWLLDQHIPWQAFTSAPHHGLVFEAALESSAPPSGAEFISLARTASRLYQWLAANYLSFPEPFRERIEDLLFRKARYAGDLQLLSAFAPFRLSRSKQRLNLEEVRRLADRGTLYALPADSDPDRFLGRHQQALLLTPLQKDFLLNHLNLPLVVPAAPMARDGGLGRTILAVRRKVARLLGRLPRPPVRRVPPGAWSEEERLLCRELEGFWSRSPHDARPAPVAISVVMAGGRGLAPAVWLPQGAVPVLGLRRRHPLVVLAARSVARDRASVELAVAALAPDHPLTPAARWL